MDLEDVIAESRRLGPWTHLATVTPEGRPHVVPVHPAWHGGQLWIMVGLGSVKVRNIRHRPDVMCHWQVSETTGFDSLMVWGLGRIHDDPDTRRRMWTGVFDYDLDAFAPGGPDRSPDVGFVAVEPTRAVVLRFFGQGGREVWVAS